MSHDIGTPEGFRFLTNVGPSGFYDVLLIDTDTPTDDEFIERLIEQHGEDNVVVNEPAYDVDGNQWNGRAIHLRESEVVDESA